MQQNNNVEYSSSTWIGDRVRLRQLIFHISSFDDDVDENNSDENGDDECYQSKQNDTHIRLRDIRWRLPKGSIHI